DSDKAAYDREKALDYIGDHKGRLPVVIVARVAIMWEVYKPFWKIPLDVFENGRGPIDITRLALAQYYVLALLSIGGLVILRRRKIPISPLLGLIALATIAAMLAFGSTRSRVPGEIALVVLGSVTIDAAIGWVMRRTRDAGRVTPGVS